MTDVDRLLEQYIQEHRGGGQADPLSYLGQLEGTDRAELAALMDAYLERAPGREWDPEAYAGSPAEQLVTSLSESLEGVSGSWPVLLPSLRERMKIARDVLVERLADALGVGGREEKVALYYNQMEHGQLEPAGVSDRVLDALAGIVGTTKQALRDAGTRTFAPEGEATAFTRPRLESAEAMPAAAASPGRTEPLDEVDELFLGG